MNFFLALINFFMPARWYIVHEERMLGEPMDRSYFGPFTRRGAAKRLSDVYADLLLFGEDDLYLTQLTWREAREIPFIASKDFWDRQAEDLADDEPAAWQEEN